MLPAVSVVPAGREGWGGNPIDAFVSTAWDAVVLTPTMCDDAVFLRRAYLDLIGVVPTLEETERFLAAKNADKRERLVDELLARDGDWADHWTVFWEDALVSSRAGVTGGMASHGDYSGWIREAFVANRPFDLFAAELIDPTMPRHKKAEMGSDNGQPRRVHFVLNASRTDTLQTAAAVGQVFMGTAMKCAGCHNHFENKEWPQRRFTAFASLFSAEDLDLVRCERPLGEKAPAAFPFALPGEGAGASASGDANAGESARAASMAAPRRDSVRGSRCAASPRGAHAHRPAQRAVLARHREPVVEAVSRARAF